MLIKISTGLPTEALTSDTSPKFVLFDHAEEVRFGPAKDFDNNESCYFFLTACLPETRLQRFINPHVERGLGNGHMFALEYPLNSRHRYMANEITFTRKGDSHRVVFDGVAYICSDEGKTLEKVWAGGGYDAGEQDQGVGQVDTQPVRSL